MIITIQAGSEAYTAIAYAMLNNADVSLSVTTRDADIFVKADSGVWSPALSVAHLPNVI